MSAGTGDAAGLEGAGGAEGAEGAGQAGGVPAGGGHQTRRLDQADLTARISKKEEAELLGPLQSRLLHLRLVSAGLIGSNHGHHHAHDPHRAPLGPPLSVVMEGWDAAGKGGAIRRLTSALDPRHVRVAEFAAPSPEEKRRHFLARFVPSMPGWGGMTVFDRSWYGRVLVERVEGFCSEAEWRRAYDEINTFESAMSIEGMVIVKFWLHISDQEQLRRFESRRDDPLKSWKLTDEDWRNRKRRPDYEEAAEEMFARTDTPAAPWEVIPAESKGFARVEVLRRVISHFEAGFERCGLEVPPVLEHLEL